MPVRWKFSTIASTISTNHKTAAYLQQVESNISVALAFRQTVVQKYNRAKARCFRVYIFRFYFCNSVCGRRPWKFIKNGTNYSGKYENGSDPNHLIESNQAVRPRSGRIIQGINADYGEWPWQISIRKWIKGIHLLNGNSLIFTNIFQH